MVSINITLGVTGTKTVAGREKGAVGDAMYGGASTYHTVVDIEGSWEEHPLTSLYSFPGILAYHKGAVHEVGYDRLPIGALIFFSRQLERELEKLKSAINQNG